MRSSTAALLALLPALAVAQTKVPFSFENQADLGISAQMMYLGSDSKVYILDKAENNPARIEGRFGPHPAWAVEYDWATQDVRHMDVFSNTFCAGGIQLGNGTWAVFGGNKPVTTNGDTAEDEGNLFRDTDGGAAIRMLAPNMDGGSTEYIQGEQTFFINQNATGGYLQMHSKRWYPSVETLGDGTSVIIGGDRDGGYINDAGQDNPTYEFFPNTDEGQVNMPFLAETLPINLYPLVWLMPSGKLFVQSNRKTILWDLKTKERTDLPDMPHATRLYPGSGATVMLPLTPKNNYTPTLLFCGGHNTTEWGDSSGPKFNITAAPADNTCVRITPEGGEGEVAYVDDDNMPEGRSMGEFVLMPDGNIWMGNGVGMGTAGYGAQNYSTGVSYGQDPLYMPAMYMTNNEDGKRWDRTNMTASENERMYHSTALLLPDSSILVAGSNPNADFTTAQWRSRTDIERWYPAYFNEPRPSYTGLPEKLSYGGKYFDLVINGTSEDDAKNTKVTLHRNGFHTHGLAMGQRLIELESAYTIDKTAGTTTLHVSQLPSKNGPNLFQPGHAMLFVVTNGVASIGKHLMVGTGELGEQPTENNAALPESKVSDDAASPSSSASVDAASPSESGSNPQGAADKGNAGMAVSPLAGSLLGAVGLVVASLLM